VRKIIAYLAVSADGFIARPNGAVEWLDRFGKAGDYGMGRFYRSIDTVLMGRKTWQVGRRLGQASYPGKTNYVFTRRPRRAHPPITFVHRPLRAFLRKLRTEPGRDVWLVGGAELFGAVLDAKQLDELILHVVPTLIGKGIPLFGPRHRNVPLRLVDHRAYRDGVVRLHYAVREKSVRSGTDRGSRTRIR
jgi:dihydrofolate reductase